MTSKRDGKMRMGVIIIGGGGHWLDPDVRPGGAAEIESYVEYAKIAEAAKIDFAFIADSAYITKDSTYAFLSRLEPITALSAIASVTERIGLVGTMSTSYSYPFTTARQMASLDKVSHGRAGWNAVTSALEGVAKNYGGEKLHPHALRYKIADEYIEVVKGLWDSWEDDAFVRDRETGVYADLDKMHTLDHKGEFFQVQGPLNMERSRQGRPVIFQAGASDAGRNLAAKYADCIFSGFGEIEKFADAQAFYRDIKQRTVAHGRKEDDILIFPGVSPIVGSTQEEADAKYQRETSFIDIDHALKFLARYFSFYDFSQHDLDAPLPDGLEGIGDDSFKSTAKYFLDLAKEENLTLRELALRATMPKGQFCGTPEYIADKMQEAFEGKAVDGFNLIGTHAHFRDFTEQVVPILQKRGLFREEYEADTLRGNLGLDYPENSFVAAAGTQG